MAESKRGIDEVCLDSIDQDYTYKASCLFAGTEVVVFWNHCEIGRFRLKASYNGRYGQLVHWAERTDSDVDDTSF